MSYTPGDTFKVRFATHEPDTASRKDAQSLPTATLIRNGDNTAETVTVANVTTGDYSAAGTIPAGWDAGDEIALKIEATVQESDGETNITANRMIDLGVLDKRTNALNDFDPASETVQNVDTVATLTGHTPQTGDTFAQLPTNFSSLGINASGHVERVVLVDTTTANTDMRGTDNALLAASAPANFSDLAITETSGEVTAANMRGTNNASTHSANDVRDAILDDGTRFSGADIGTIKSETDKIDDIVTGATVIRADDRNGNAILSALHQGTAQGGTGTTITLATDAPEQNQVLRDMTVRIVGGTGVGQGRLITDYNGNTKVATVDQAWSGPSPDETSEYEIDGGPSRLSRIEHTGATIPTVLTVNALAASERTAIRDLVANAKPSDVNSLDSDGLLATLQTVRRTAPGSTTGTWDVYSDDGETVLFTLTPPTTALEDLTQVATGTFDPNGSS